jgi:hypothetical protein
MKFKKNLLLWNYWANFNQTLLKWSLGGPLSKLCPSAPSCIQDGRHYKKIEISLNGQNWSILSQKVHKFVWRNFYFFVMAAILDTRRRWRTQFFKGDHPRIISAKFGWDWLSSFRGEDFYFNFIPPLYKHDELFNIYDGIFYELWTFACFDRLCKLEKRGDEIKKKSSPLA